MGTQLALLPTEGKAVILATEPAEGAQDVIHPKFITDSKEMEEMGTVIEMAWILSNLFHRVAEKQKVTHWVKAH